MAKPEVILSVPLGTVLKAGSTVEIYVAISGVDGIKVTGTHVLDADDFTLGAGNPGDNINGVGGSGKLRTVSVTLPSIDGDVVLTLAAGSVEDVDNAGAAHRNEESELTLPVVSDTMTFFSDALYGKEVTVKTNIALAGVSAWVDTTKYVKDTRVRIGTSPEFRYFDCIQEHIASSLNEPEGTDPNSVWEEYWEEFNLGVYDKKVRTGLSKDGGFSVDLSFASIDYDVVVLVFRNGTGYTITPTANPIVGAKSVSGLNPSFRQFAYVPFSVTNGTQLTVALTGRSGADEPDPELQEIYVLKKEFSVLDTADILGRTERLERPMRYVNFGIDPGRRAYYSEDETLITYSGQSPYGKADIRIGWDYLPQVWVDKFRELFRGPPLRKKFFIYPEPVQYPNEVYYVYWENDFQPRPSAATLAAGYSLDLRLLEN